MLRLFDADPRRRRAWQALGEENLDVKHVESGEAMLSDAALNAWRPDHPAFVLVDPYDLFDHWGTWMPRIESIAGRVPVLAYLYDKSVRSAGHRDQFRRLQDRLERIRSRGLGVLLGRIASDRVAPRAHHVVVLVADPAIITELREGLEVETETLAADQACDEEFVVFEE